jgi:hypothetical protein
LNAGDQTIYISELFTGSTETGFTYIKTSGQTEIADLNCLYESILEDNQKLILTPAEQKRYFQ